MISHREAGQNAGSGSGKGMGSNRKAGQYKCHHSIQLPCITYTNVQKQASGVENLVWSVCASMHQAGRARKVGVSQGRDRLGTGSESGEQGQVMSGSVAGHANLAAPPSLCHAP